MLAKNLAEDGLSQIQIAEALGITQAAVSKYLHQNEESHQLSPHVSSLTSSLAKAISSKSISSDLLVKEVCSTCMSLRIGSDICTLHRSAIPSLSEVNCQICTDLLGGSNPDLTSRAKVLEDLQSGLRIIQNSTVFAQLVPQVRANLVTCNGLADDVSDVAGVPGRITIIEGKARILVGPRFGASKHTASLLLEMKKSWSHVRACLCISGKSDVVKIAKAKKVRIIELTTSESDHNQIAASAVQKLPTSRSRAHIGIHVPGGVGVEPILYIFGSSAKELGELCEEIGQKIRT